MPVSNNINILLIGGSIDNAMLTQGALQGLGYRVYLSTDGLLGWQRAYTHTPQLILLDLDLPTLPGLQVLARLKSERATTAIPVVMLGVQDRTDHAPHVKDMCADAYLAKDHTFDELYAVVKQVLRSGPLNVA